MKKLLMAGLALASLTGVSYAADMPVKARPMPVAIYSWNGFYIGGNAGYSWGRANTDQIDSTAATSTTRCFRTLSTTPPSDEVTGPTPICSPPNSNLIQTFPIVTATTGVAGATSSSANVDGFVGGGQIGYNWQQGTWLYGLETDLQYSAQRGDSVTCTTATCVAGTAFGSASHSIRWFGTFRGRLGYLPTDRILLYVTGGAAYAGINSDYISGINGLTLVGGSTSNTRLGWTVGGGVEGAVADRWTVKVEYLYADYGSYDANLGLSGAVTTVGPKNFVTSTAGTQTTTVTTLGATTNTSVTDHIVRVGLNYRWGTP
jgi:outer membrane immunogenic protein